MKFDEKKLIEVARPYFDSARSGDWEHALRVVKWVKELGNGRSDLSLLITASYIHDIGWSGVAPRGKLDLDEMLALEPRANENSSRLIFEVLAKLKFTDPEIDTIKRLVAAADKHQSERDDEAVMVDADNLSKLCFEHLEQKYQPASFSKMIALWENELAGRIRTERGKELFPELLSDLKQKLNLNHQL
ncbi:MAG: HD domain-containing protein [Candidatus Brennerbacteria bacterium]